ncbi:uncharacterized protein [Physcomitrium patens]|uniref:uncharacterized protein isoform X2 n=1 Tax=Physcomitrium patens TaxID=3218 RepID=UPI003CCD822B
MASDLPAGAFSKPSTIRAAADRSSNDLSPVLNDRDNVCCHRVIAFRLSSSSQDGWHGMELATKQDTPVHKLLLSKTISYLTVMHNLRTRCRAFMRHCAESMEEIEWRYQESNRKTLSQYLYNVKKYETLFFTEIKECMSHIKNKNILFHRY